MNSQKPVLEVVQVFMFYGEASEVDLSKIDAQRITSDSRKVRRGGIFFCLKDTDPRREAFVQDAIQRGASAIVISAQDRDKFADAGGVKVYTASSVLRAFTDALKKTLSIKQHPTFAVTGTNGKTSVTYLLRHLAPIPTAVIGTICDDLIIKILPAKNTTPGVEELYRMVAEVPDGAAIAMEASSHALDQQRLFGLPIDVALFTNLASDHMDYHLDRENYFMAKQRLFSSEYSPKINIINAGDLYGQWLKTMYGGVTYAIDLDADYRATIEEISLMGTRFVLNYKKEKHRCIIPLIGKFNVENSLAAIAAIHQQFDVPLASLCAKLADFSFIPGRLERIENNCGFEVFVDFAHTEDGLRNILCALRPFTRSLTVVFGCGGDRDKTKRPKMMSVAYQIADKIIATSDNARQETIEMIFFDMKSGIASDKIREKKLLLWEPDREKAIQRAILDANPGDIVVIAGKGHEKTQQIGDKYYPFCDQDCARKYIAMRSENL